MNANQPEDPTMLAISLLFAMTALLSVGTILREVRQHGNKALALRKQLAVCPQTREMRYRIVELGRSNIVPFPLKQRAAVRLAGLRAAA